MPQAVQIHDQKGQIKGAVAVPETLVELDAVDDLHPVVKIDMLGPQVSVPVADAALPHPVREQLGMVVCKRAADLPEKLPFPRIEQILRKGPDLREILLHVEADMLSIAVRVDALPALGPCVESGQGFAKT